MLTFLNSDTKNEKSLLKTDDVAIPHIMGIIISAPLSHISDATIPPYDPAKQQPRNVFPDTEPKFFPIRKEANTCWSPREPMKDQSGEVSEVQWTMVSERWKKELKSNAPEDGGKGGGKARDTVREWCDAFSWTSRLTGWAPKRLTEDFGNLYPAPPMLSKG